MVITKKKKDLVQAIAKAHNMDNEQAQAVVQTLLDEIIAILAAGQRLEMRYFGIFEMVYRRGKIGRNPKQSDIAIPIPPKAVVKFRAGKRMKKIMQHYALLRKSISSETP